MAIQSHCQDQQYKSRTNERTTHQTIMAYYLQLLLSTVLKVRNYGKEALIIFLIIYSLLLTIYKCDRLIFKPTEIQVDTNTSRCLVEARYCYLSEDDLYNKLARRLNEALAKQTAASLA